MMHAKKIEELIDAGASEEAHEAIDNLLILGPNNLSALKLKADLYGYTANFEEESKVWQKVLKIDPDDTEAHAYVQRRQGEDREFLYFTEPLEGGGRRFFAYPHKMLQASTVGLFGCMSFILLSHYGIENKWLQNDALLMTLFFVCIVMPWSLIIHHFVKSVKFVVVSPTSLSVLSRFKKHEYKWEEIENVYLAHQTDAETNEIRLILVPFDKSRPSLDLNFGDKSIVKARWHFLAELSQFFRKPYSIKLAALPQHETPSLKY